jgi:thiol:disulfide interchange protein DsbA
VKQLKPLIIILLASLTLIGCQQDDADKNPSNSTTSNPTATQGDANDTQPASSESQHDHEAHSEQATETGYIEIEPQDSCDQPTVIEFFAYQCPHCYQLEKHAEKWKAAQKQNPTARFIAIPSTLGREEFIPLIIIHHTAEKTGVLDKIQPKMFAMLHEQKGGFKNLDELVKIFVDAGANEQQVRETLQNEAYLKGKFEADYETMKKYKITGVPTLLVNYQYQINVASAGGYDKVFEVVDKALALPAKCAKQ